MTERSCLLLTSLAAAGLLAASGAGAEPFATRNQNPLVTLFGLPTPLPARLSADGPGRLGVMANWGNMATIRGRDDNLLVDAETVELRVAYERSAGSRFAIRAEVPWRSIGGGSLDGVAETWHDLLGLPDGDRAGLPRDQLQVRYTVDDAVLLDFNESASGIGDVTLAGGYPLYASDRASVAAWLTAKLPTGDAARLTGSGATDVALSLAADTALADRWRLFGQVDAVWLGRGDLLPELQEQLAWQALAGLAWNAWRSLDLLVQVQANSAVFDGDATGFSGAATVLTFGGRYRNTRGWAFEVAFSEDLQVGASPDFVIHFGIARSF